MGRWAAAVLVLAVACAGGDGARPDLPGGDAPDAVPDADGMPAGDDGGAADPAADPDRDPGPPDGTPDPGTDGPDGDGTGDDGGPDADAGPPFPALDPAACRAEAPADLLGFDPAYAPPAGAPVLRDKAWFLWSVVLGVAEARAAVTGDEALSALSADRTAGLRAATACGDDVACLRARLAWSEEDRASAAKDLARVLATTAVAGDHLRPSGRFALHAGLDDGGLAALAADEALATLGAVLEDHVLAAADRADRVAAVSADHPGDLLFFEPVLHLALAGLAADGRDEAERYEPLALGENAAAVARAAGIHWDDWRFTAILVPGWGPDDPSTPLSDTGREHCDIAVERWQAGLAPFLLLSGGHVHPDRTPYAEAIEMKKYLREAHGVPEDALLVDPHARHTTTNLRNAARILLRAGVPADRPVLVSTDFLQAPYITALGDRCDRELGYRPWRTIAALSGNDDCFLPAAEALHADARDPLDP